jgi:hypothetical protein
MSYSPLIKAILQHNSPGVRRLRDTKLIDVNPVLICYERGSLQAMKEICKSKYIKTYILQETDSILEYFKHESCFKKDKWDILWPYLRKYIVPDHWRSFVSSLFYHLLTNEKSCRGPYTYECMKNIILHCNVSYQISLLLYIEYLINKISNDHKINKFSLQLLNEFVQACKKNSKENSLRAIQTIDKYINQQGSQCILN